MKIMISSVCIISLILQSIFSNFTKVINSYMNPLFAICALIIVYPYFKDKNKFLLVCFLYGTCYDILFSSFLFIHAFLFVLLGYIIMILNHLWTHNILNTILFAILTISIYKVIYYFLLAVIDKIEWTSTACFQMISHSLLMNIFYITILYFITDFISKKYKIRKVE